MRRSLLIMTLCALLLVGCASAGTPASVPADQATEQGAKPDIPAAQSGTPAVQPASAEPGRFLPGTFQAQVRKLPEIPRYASALFFRDEQHGWLGDGNRLLASDDGGKSWHVAATLNGLIHAISFVTPELGYVGTEKGLSLTQDGGRTWQPMKALENSPVYNLNFADAQHGWIAGEARAVRLTTDGGTTWAVMTNPCALTSGSDFLSFTSAQNGWYLCVSNRARMSETRELYQTRDGGLHWARVAGSGTGELPVEEHAARLFFADDVHGWIATENGQLLATADGGRTWKQHGAALDAGALGLQFLDAQTGYQLIDADAGLLAITHDAGATWTPVYPLLRPSVLGPRQFFDADTGVAAFTRLDPELILHTADGGRTWQPLGRIEGMRVNELSFADPLHGWAAGQVEHDSWAIYATGDGGKSWRRLEHAPASRDAQFHVQLSLVDAKTGYMTGDNRQLFVTHDGGESFQAVDQPTMGRQQVHFTTAEHGWQIVSYQLFETKDGGASWQPVPLTTWMHPESLQVLPDGRLIMAVMDADNTDAGGILFSSDGGHSWTGYETPDLVPTGVSFAPDGQHGWFTTGTAQFRTADGGRSWEQLP